VRVGLTEHANRVPDAIVRAAQKQRVGIARALSDNPKVFSAALRRSHQRAGPAKPPPRYFSWLPRSNAKAEPDHRC